MKAGFRMTVVSAVVGTDTFANVAAESRCSWRGETDGGCGRSFFIKGF